VASAALRLYPAYKTRKANLIQVKVILPIRDNNNQVPVQGAFVIG
jgi:hypothetical protein